MVDGEGKPPMTDGYLSQIAIKAKCVSISWQRHNVAFSSLFTLIICYIGPYLYIFVFKFSWYLYLCIILLCSTSCIYKYIMYYFMLHSPK